MNRELENRLEKLEAAAGTRRKVMVWLDPGERPEDHAPIAEPGVEVIYVGWQRTVDEIHPQQCSAMFVIDRQ